MISNLHSMAVNASQLNSDMKVSNLISTTSIALSDTESLISRYQSESEILINWSIALHDCKVNQLILLDKIREMENLEAVICTLQKIFSTGVIGHGAEWLSQIESVHANFNALKATCESYLTAHRQKLEKLERADRCKDCGFKALSIGQPNDLQG